MAKKSSPPAPTTKPSSAKSGASTPDWSTLKHARGPALDVEANLAALSNASAQRRATGLELLRETLYSKEKHYSAGTAATPILLDKALDASTPDRHTLLALVADVLAGDHTTKLTTGIDLSNEATQKTFARGDAKKVLAAVTDRLEPLTALLSDREAPVRAAVAFLLAFTPTAIEATGALVERVSTEQDVGARTAAILCLGYFARYGSAAAKNALLRLADDSVPETRGAGVLAALLDHQPPKAIAADKLAGYFLIGDLPAIACPFNRGQLIRLGTAICAAAGDAARTAAVDALVKCVVDTRGDTQHKLDDDTGWVPALLDLEIPKREDSPMPDEFTPRQREIFAALSRFPLSQMAFFRHGLPIESETRRRWLGMDPAGALERVLPLGAPGAQPNWQVWQSVAAFQGAGTDEAEIDAKLREHLGPKELAETYAEWSMGTYGLGEPSTELALAAFADAGPHAIEVARTFLEKAFRSELGARIVAGSLPPGLGVGASNVAIKTLLDAMPADSRMLAAEYDPMVQILPDDTTHEILATIPMDRRERLLAAVFERPGMPRVSLVAHHLDLVPSPGLIGKLLDAVEHAPDNYTRNEYRGYVLPPLKKIVQTHPEIQQLLDQRGFSLS